jgi:hypothetical protein
MTDQPSRTGYDDEEMRCPRLGGPVTFAYCRIENVGKPCSRAILCWGLRFDAEGLFRKMLDDDQYRECFEKATPSRVVTLVELIEKAKKLTDKKREKES